jgi:hypothetical protein
MHVPSGTTGYGTRGNRYTAIGHFAAHDAAGELRLSRQQAGLLGEVLNRLAWVLVHPASKNYAVTQCTEEQQQERIVGTTLSHGRGYLQDPGSRLADLGFRFELLVLPVFRNDAPRVSMTRKEFHSRFLGAVVGEDQANRMIVSKVTTRLTPTS